MSAFGTKRTFPRAPSMSRGFTLSVLAIGWVSRYR
jgi:hypothetical protein